MGLFDDFSRLLEIRLEEFLRNNPQLELQALAENLREQEEDTSRLLIDLQAQEKQLQTDILNTAQEIQRWHGRIEKAQTAGRQDLAQAAQEREAALLRQGNQRWGQMEVLKERIQQTEELQRKIQSRQQEVRDKIKQEEATPTAASSSRQATSGWYHTPQSKPDPSEDQFRPRDMHEQHEALTRTKKRAECR